MNVPCPHLTADTCTRCADLGEALDLLKAFLDGGGGTEAQRRAALRLFKKYAALLLPTPPQVGSDTLTKAVRQGFLFSPQWVPPHCKTAVVQTVFSFGWLGLKA
jgi:hypothetical protein